MARRSWSEVSRYTSPRRSSLSRFLLDAAGDTRVGAADFAPLPCSHPLCFNLAYYLMLDDRGLDDKGIVSLNRLVDASRMMDCLANRTIFGLDETADNKNGGFFD